jgi:hypothetical protein
MSGINAPQSVWRICSMYASAETRSLLHLQGDFVRVWTCSGP